MHFFLLAWVLVGLWAEVQELLTSEVTVAESIRIAIMSQLDSRVKSAYYAATLNGLDLPAAVLTLIALILRTQEALERESNGEEGYGVDGGWSRPIPLSSKFLGPAVLLLWVRQLRILLNIPAIGPLVLMILRMVTDILKWAVRALKTLQPCQGAMGMGK